jgi:hypothetical protein
MKMAHVKHFARLKGLVPKVPDGRMRSGMAIQQAGVLSNPLEVDEATLHAMEAHLELTEESVGFKVRELS